MKYFNVDTNNLQITTTSKYDESDEITTIVLYSKMFLTEVE